MADARVRSELMWCCCIGLLMHTNLRAQLSSWECSWNEQGAAGSQFAGADRAQEAGGKVLPILAPSHFNGIGCCFRCYDLV